MAKKGKSETLNLYYLNTNEAKSKKGKKKDVSKPKKETSKKKKNTSSKAASETTFSFSDNEIVVGMTKKVESTSKEEKAKKHKKSKKKEIEKGNKKKGAGRKTAPKEDKKQEENLFDFDKEIVIGMKQIAEPKGKTKPNSKKEEKKGKKNTKAGQAHKKKQEKGKALTKEQEKAKKRRKILLGFVKWIVLLGALLGAILFFLMTPLFNVAEIAVEGNEKVTEQEIISLSGITIGENTYKISKNQVKRKVKENPYLKDVTIRRKLPNKIVIQVKERKATYALRLVNGYVYINNQGYLLEIAEENNNLPVITGYATSEEKLTPGNRLNEEDLVKLSDVLKIMETANNNDLQNKITEIKITDKTNYVLLLAEEQKTVYLGDTSDLSTKMLYIKKIIETEKKAGEIFLNRNIKKAIFREAV